MPPPVIPLACTVRACGLALTRRDRAYMCGNGHAFDVSRRGYVNLLQPQDRRSLEAGDRREAVAARTILEAQGIGRMLADAVASRATVAVAGPETVIVEVGSGTGALLDSLAGAHGAVGIGIDLSTAAAEHAARHHPSHTWVVANADRRLPLLDRSVHVVLSVHARRNPGECARVLVEDGHAIVAVPAADDLIELRTAVQGQGVERDRGEALVADYQSRFALVHREVVHAVHTLDRDMLRNLLQATYRGARTSSQTRVADLSEMTVTFASELLTFRAAR